MYCGLISYKPEPVLYNYIFGFTKNYSLVTEGDRAFNDVHHFFIEK